MFRNRQIFPGGGRVVRRSCQFDADAARQEFQRSSDTHRIFAENRPEFDGPRLVRPVQFRRGMDNAPRLHQEVTDRIIRVFWDVVNELGTGYLEKIYRRAMVIALRQAGFEVIENYKTVVHFRGEGIGQYVFDLVVNGCILLELKATGEFERAHAAQALGYLRSSELEVALILNFGQNPSVRRVSMTNDRKRLHQFPAEI